MVQRKRAVERLVSLMNLIETVVYVMLFGVLLGSVTASFTGRKAYAVRAAVQSFGALLDEGRAVAQTSGSGATIAIVSDGSSGFSATLYPFRPLPGADTSASALRAISAGVGLTPTAIFLSSSGTASAAAWTPGSSTPATEPPCNKTIALTFTDGTLSEAHTIACATSLLQ